MVNSSSVTCSRSKPRGHSVRALRPFGQTMVFTFDRTDGPSLVVESMASLHRRIALWVEANRHDMLEIAPLERAFDQQEAPIQAMLCGDIPQVRAAEQALRTMERAGQITMHRTEYAERDLGILDLLPPHCSKGRALEDYVRSLGLEAQRSWPSGTTSTIRQCWSLPVKRS